jgi:hypothetical protein
VNDFENEDYNNAYYNVTVIEEGKKMNMAFEHMEKNK